jgi:hypothetical protein
LSTQPPITAQGQALKNAAVVVSLKRCHGWQWFQDDASNTLQTLADDILDTMPLDGDMMAIRLKIANYRAIKLTAFTRIEQMAAGAESVMAAAAGEDMPENHLE